MGAYLTAPNTEKVSHDESHEKMLIGVSGMQGWRMSMEDAHCALTNFDNKDSSLFGVFDGHGGKEVAEYCAQNYHKFLLDSEAYEEGDIHKALKDTFMAIDEALTSVEVIEELKVLGGIEGAHDEEEDEAAMLLEEANMPIEELLERIKDNVKEKLAQNGFYQGDDEKEEEEKQNGHVDDAEGATNGASDKSSKRKQKKPIKRNPSPEDSDKQPSNATNSSDKSSSNGSAHSGGSKEEVGISAAASDKESSASANGASAISSSASSSGPSTSTGEGSTKEEDDPDYVAEDGPDKEESDEEEGDEDDASSSLDDDDESDSEEEFEDSEGVEFQQGSDEVGKDSGTTAIIALIHKNKLYVANVGDSRCVLCRSGKPVEMSFDHKPEDEKERNRIEKAGGKITMDGRVNGGLNLSRALGDHIYKQNKDIPPEEQAITAYPDILDIKLTKDDDFMVLACDGIWNMMSNEEVIEFVKDRLNSKGEETPKLSKICEELFEHCMAPDTDNDGSGCDNMTCLIVRFKNQDTTEKLSTTSSQKRNNEESENNERDSKKAKIHDTVSR